MLGHHLQLARHHLKLAGHLIFPWKNSDEEVSRLQIKLYERTTRYKGPHLKAVEDSLNFLL